MQKRILNLVCLLLVATVSFTSCSKFSKIQKSTDMEAKYEAAVKYYNAKKYYQALQLFEELITVFRGTVKAEDIYYYYAMCYYETGEYNVAAYHFNNFSQTFPSSPRAEEALFLNAYCYYIDSAPSTLDQTSTREAINQFQLFVNRYPKSPKVDESNKYIDELRLKLETKDYDIAMLYYKKEQYKSAVVALNNVIKTYPSTIFKEECLFYILKSSLYYANQSTYRRQAERYKITIENYYRLIDTFPESAFLKEAEKVFSEATDKLKKIEKGVSVI